jgi:cellulose synthase/poly-beta-1,6-N-acetylglucosamine synthase-like glycosyltransferase
MNPLFYSLIVSFVILFLAQFVLVAGFVYRLKQKKVPLLDDALCPQSIVIVCLRGGDPFLSKCISGLLRQDYPNFGVRFIVDNATDPSMSILDSELSKHSFVNFRIEILESPRTTCSLKCSSLVQAIEGLPEQTNFVALLDADTIPHASWLRELATALANENVGAVTGNRWYMPDRSNAGALIRYVWNAAAVVQMYWYGIAWGGTLAIKMESLRRAGLLDRWKKSLCEDTMLRSQLSRINQRVEFVPSLMMINREDCSLSSFMPWVERQLLTARLYHPAWIAVLVHGFGCALFALLGWGLVAICVVVGNWAHAANFAAVVAIYQACISGLVMWLERAVSEAVRKRGEETRWGEDVSWYQMAWIIWITQWIYTWSLAKALFRKNWEWRQIHYRIDGPWKIQMLGYQPFSPVNRSSKVDGSSL